MRLGGLSRATRRTFLGAPIGRTQLEDQTIRFLNDRNRNYYEGESERLFVSPLFDWYAGDFQPPNNQSPGGVIGFLLHYAAALELSADQQKRLAEGKVTIDYSNYDWRLNAVDGCALKRKRMSQSLSIIIPVFNEAEALPSLLESLQPLRAAGVEVIVSDGGSSDDSRAIADPLTDVILEGEIGRSAQMNAAAKVARGDWLLFLHADSVLPAFQHKRLFRAWLVAKRSGDGFESLSPDVTRVSLTAWLMNRRSKWTSIATGDQGLFVRNSLFRSCDGFPEQLLMEDIALCRDSKGWLSLRFCS